MYGFFSKNPFFFVEIVTYSFFSFENKPLGSKQVLLGVKIEGCLGSK